LQPMPVMSLSLAPRPRAKVAPVSAA
jgi:hypothetical protein